MFKKPKKYKIFILFGFIFGILALTATVQVGGSSG